ncbi:PLP-dependent transferase [Xylariaceae sp. FL0662B]|nr:PLP-dependent transferase [Xylariaceae sp. FL0662B]
MDTNEFLTSAYAQIRAAASASATPSSSASPAAPRTLPTLAQLAAARASLPDPSSPSYLAGRGAAATLSHLTSTIAPALTAQALNGARYFGFVTGAALPVAEAADNLVSAFDQNVQVHLPDQSVATEVEDAALRMVLRLLRLDDASASDEGEGEGLEGLEGLEWEGRTFTTGATASNVLGLACGREVVVRARLPHPGAGEGGDDEDEDAGVGELGLLRACAAAGVREVRVLTSMGHSSLAKAASVVGLGRRAVRELPHSDAEPWRLDLDAVERELMQQGDVACIIAVSAGEVNTGRFATTGLGDMKRLRALADEYRAWIHVDGAFGIFARALPATSEFARLHEYAAGLELADSITVDGHKLLNVPYDNGIFFTRKSSLLTSVFQNPNAAYLSSPSPSPSGSGADGPAIIQSPLNVGLENSRRFRALPVYAVLLSLGRDGVAAMLARMVRLARGIAAAVRESADYVLLPEADDDDDGTRVVDVKNDDGGDGIENDKTHIIVLFRARDAGLNAVLTREIQRGAEWYVSGTRWKGQPACRVAVASWRVDVEADVELVRSSLARIAREYKDSIR